MTPRIKLLTRQIVFVSLFLFASLISTACGSEEPQDTPVEIPTLTPVAPDEPPVEPDVTQTPWIQSRDEIEFVTVLVDAPSRYRDFTDIDPFGRVQGFDAEWLGALGASAGFEVEFVVTGFDGALEAVAQGEFDTAAGGLLIPETVPAGVAFTQPYLEIGQVLVVRANQPAETPAELPDGSFLGVVRGGYGEQIARDQIGWPEDRRIAYDSVPELLQGLVDRDVDGVVLDSDDALAYTNDYYQQLRIAGGEGAWLATQQYGIAVASENRVLLDWLNELIAAEVAGGTVDELTDKWLIATERIDAGESLIGTQDREFVVGLVTADTLNLDPVGGPNPTDWEIKSQFMSGLYRFDSDDVPIPLIAADYPGVSPDGLEYTIPIRQNLTFPNGDTLDGADVIFSLRRSIASGNFLINSILKDANIDGFADDDAIELVDPFTVRLRVDEPTSYMLSILASPPYFVVSESCYDIEADRNNTCGGLGPYQITDYEPGVQIRMSANSDWPGEPPLSDNLQIRFYTQSEPLLEALDNQALDLVWSGLSSDTMVTLGNSADYILWEGPAWFKSYLVFQHDAEPWDNPAVRQAAALAIDRDALSRIFGGSRIPLFGPIPNEVPGFAAINTERDLDAAIALLEEAGYTAENKASFTLDYTDDGRYSPFEAEYALLIENQLEETGLFEVTLTGAPYDTFRQKSIACESDAFLLGWPPSGQSPYYNDGFHWMNFFVFNTTSLCSNYESLEMDVAVQAAEFVNPADFDGREAAYTEVQLLWAETLPTLDLTQEIRLAVSLPKVAQVEIDSMGFLRYDLLQKSGE